MGETNQDHASMELSLKFLGEVPRKGSLSLNGLRSISTYLLGFPK